jgi:tetratricopeptide (TPR) repeat protein
MHAFAGLVLAAAVSGGGADAAASGAASGWSRVRTAHFEVLTDAGAPLAGNVAQRLETLRSVLLDVFPPRAAGERLVVVIALASRDTFEHLVPSRHAQARRLGGFFQGGSEWDTIVARLSLEAPGPYAAFDHEYAHLVLNRSLPAQPVWVAEGLAELMSDAQLEGPEAQIGARQADLEAQARAAAWTLASLLGVRHDSPEYLGAKDDAALYARAWALARWTLFRHGQPGLRVFLDDVAQGRDAAEAFVARFGALDAAQATLYDLPPGPLVRRPLRADLDAAGGPPDAPSAAEVEHRLGELLLQGGETAKARAHVERALAAAPDYAPARLSLADLYLRGGDRAAARRELDRALRLAPDDPAALLRSVRLQLDDALQEGVELSAAAEDRVVAQLERALAGAPGLYEAALLLAELRPQPYAGRIAALLPVFEADPARTEVALSLAALHVKRRDLASAQGVLARACAAARDPAYLFLCERRLEQVEAYASATVQVRGRLLELVCRPDGSLAFMVETPGGVLRLEAASTRSFLVYEQEASAESDLVCGAHGRTIVVRYRPSGTPTVQGEVVWLSFTDREPAPSRPHGRVRRSAEK